MNFNLLRKYLPIFFALFLFLIGAMILKNVISNENERIKKLEIHLEGRVTKVNKLKYGHDYGFIKMDILNSNIDFYDVRQSNDKFLGVIKNQKAEIVVVNISSFEVGDKYILDLNKYKIIRNNKIIETGTYEFLTGIGFISPYTEVQKKMTL